MRDCKAYVHGKDLAEGFRSTCDHKRNSQVIGACGWIVERYRAITIVSYDPYMPLYVFNDLVNLGRTVPNFRNRSSNK